MTDSGRVETPTELCSDVVQNTVICEWSIARFGMIILDLTLIVSVPLSSNPGPWQNRISRRPRTLPRSARESHS